MTRRNKYNAVKVWRNGECYDSKAEAEYADVLELLKRAGHIESYEHHPEPVKLANGAVKWKVDYKITDERGVFYVDVKGMETADFKIKMNLWRAEPPAPLFIVKRQPGTLPGELRFVATDKVIPDNASGCTFFCTPPYSIRKEP